MVYTHQPVIPGLLDGAHDPSNSAVMMTRQGIISFNDLSNLDIKTIAVGLANINRFNGHGDICQVSVGLHSLHCYEIAREVFPDRFDIHLQALVHDFPEALYSDIPTQVKNLIGREHLHKRLEPIDREVYRVLEVPWPSDEQREKVGAIDLDAMTIEAYRIFSKFNPKDWPTPTLYDDYDLLEMYQDYNQEEIASDLIFAYEEALENG
jgi:5'-deoxynucleotidase YfbR-like HD superfamily hydrolase